MLHDRLSWFAYEADQQVLCWHGGIADRRCLAVRRMKLHKPDKREAYGGATWARDVRVKPYSERDGARGAPHFLPRMAPYASELADLAQ